MFTQLPFKVQQQIFSEFLYKDFIFKFRAFFSSLDARKDLKSSLKLTQEQKIKRVEAEELKLDFTLHYWAGEKDCDGLTSVYRGPILLTYDHRYNLEHAEKGKPKDYLYYLSMKRDDPEWNATDCMLKPPALDAKTLKTRRVQWKEWMPPALLLECTAANGKKVHLCDFGSAGEVGTPYLSWLPVKRLGPTPDFSPTTPLGTNRCPTTTKT